MVEGSDGRGSSKPEIWSWQSAPGDPGELVAMDGELAGGVVGLGVASLLKIGHEAAAWK